MQGLEESLRNPRTSRKATVSPSQPSLRQVFRTPDLIVILLLFSAAAVMLILVTAHFSEAIVERSLGGRWFQSDGWRVYDDMVTFDAEHYRNHLRPLFSLLTLPVTTLAMWLTGISPIQAIWGFNAFCFGVWTVGIYAVVRLTGLSLLASTLMALMAMSSSAAMFWFIVPETYGLSSLCIVLSLVVAAIHVRRDVGNGVLVLVGVLLAGTLVTNLLVSVALNFAFKARRDAIRISVLVVIGFFVAWALQKVIFPAGAQFPLKKLSQEQAYVLPSEQGGLNCSLWGELVSPMLAPEVALFAGKKERTGERLTVQCGETVEQFGYVAAGLIWIGLVIYGAASLRRAWRLSRFFWFVAASLGGQILLHLLYGEETFLYALHFVPLLLVLASGALLANQRSGSKLAAVAALTVFAAVSNASHLTSALNSPSSGNDDERMTTRPGSRNEPGM